MKTLLSSSLIAVSLLLSSSPAFAGYCTDLETISITVDRIHFSTSSWTIDELYAGKRIHSLQNLAAFSAVELPYRFMKKIEKYEMTGTTPSEKLWSLNHFLKSMVTECQNTKFD
jgi:hypothetical protein